MTLTNSAINKLQQKTLDSNCSLSNVLRLALTVAVKLDLAEFEEWLQKELNGYGSKDIIPIYRQIKGQPKVHNPYNGWIPLLSEDSDYMEMISSRSIGMSIGEIESLQDGMSSDTQLQINYPPHLEAEIMKGMEFVFKPVLFIAPTFAIAILEVVRNKVLDWALRLEKEGIKGEYLEFSETEKVAASHVIYNIEQVGVLGNMSGNSTANVFHTIKLTPEVIKSISLLAENIQSEKTNLPPDIREDMVDLATKLMAAVEEEVPNEVNISNILKSIKNIAEGVTGNLIVHGIISVITSIFS
ncbi:MAG: hypothetical protein JKY59_05085 [Emcibacter sp.]|nr:hypothetical protein [Emcibacter sp.]